MKMESPKRLQSGHWAGDHVMLSTPAIHSGFFFEHLKHPFVRRAWCPAAHTIHHWKVLPQGNDGTELLVVKYVACLSFGCEQ